VYDNVVLKKFLKNYHFWVLAMFAYITTCFENKLKKQHFVDHNLGHEGLGHKMGA